MNKKDLITKNLNKVFSYKTESEAIGEIKEENLKGFMDESNAFMIIPKYETLKTYIVNTFNVQETKIPELSYNHDHPTKSSFSREYLNVLFSIAKNTKGEKFKISVGNTYPLKIETKEFIFILAPVVDNELN